MNEFVQIISPIALAQIMSQGKKSQELALIASHLFLVAAVLDVIIVEKISKNA